MKNSTIVSVTLLTLGLGAGQALAQPNPAPVKVRARPTEAGKQITGDLMDFIATLNSERMYPTAQNWVFGARTGYFGAQEWARTARWGGPIKVENIVVNQVVEENASATVTYSFATPGALDAEAKALLERERTENLSLKLGTIPFGKDRVWQIVPPANWPPLQGVNTSDSALLGSAYFLAQRGPLPLGDPKAKRTMSNLKQLALGVMQLAMDYDERYAFAPEFLQEAVTPYIKNQDLFLIPGTRDLYSFNANLSDKNLAQINQPALTVLFYEGEDEKPVFRYAGRAAIGFADGHVKMVSPEEAKTLIWKP